MQSQLAKMPRTSSFLSSALFLVCALSNGAAYDGEIISGPQTQTAAAGSVVTFTCRAIGGDAYWVIDGVDVWEDLPGIDVTFEHSSLFTQPAEWNMTVAVETSVVHNGTSIVCESTGSGVGQKAQSAAAHLIFASAPLPPATSANVVNATTIELTWTEPFTHQGYGVDHYTVTIENAVTGNTTRVDVNETRFMHARVGGIAQECVKFEFTVTASNAVGESSAMAISAGFPTVPGKLEADITVNVTLTSDAPPDVDIMFELPETCIFQTSWYTIVVEEENNNGVPVVHGPHSFTGRDPVTVEQDISDGLERGRNYSVTVWVESLAGQSPNSSDTFNTVLATPDSTMSTSTDVPTVNATSAISTAVPTADITMATPTDTPTADTTVATSSDIPDKIAIEDNAVTNSSQDDNNEKEERTLVIITGASAGFAVTVVLTVSVLSIILVGHRRHSNTYREGKSEQGKRCPPMVSNPIYEPSTPEYECIDDPNWKALTKQLRDQRVEATDPRYFNIPPPLPASPPPCKPTGIEIEPEEKEAEKLRASFCSATDQRSGDGDDCYAVMKPAGAFSCPNLPAVAPIATDDEYVTIATIGSQE